MNLRSKTLLPVAIVALMSGLATTLWADHHDDDGDATAATHDPNGGESLVASRAHSREAADKTPVVGSSPVFPAQPDNGNDEEDSGLVIREGDVIEFDNVPYIEPVRLQPASSSIPTR